MTRRRRTALGVVDLAVAALLAGLDLAALPARWWPIDAALLGLAALFAVAGGALVAGARWARGAALLAGGVALACGLVLVTLLAVTAAHLTGLYGPVGGGGALLLSVVALLVVPYLVVLPAAQLFVLLRPAPRGAAAGEAAPEAP